MLYTSPLELWKGLIILLIVQDGTPCFNLECFWNNLTNIFNDLRPTLIEIHRMPLQLW